jgi:hypothetical protein
MTTHLSNAIRNQVDQFRDSISQNIISRPVQILTHLPDSCDLDGCQHTCGDLFDQVSLVNLIHCFVNRNIED